MEYVRRIEKRAKVEQTLIPSLNFNFILGVLLNNKTPEKAQKSQKVILTQK